jgi:hypothetical protein
MSWSILTKVLSSLLVFDFNTQFGVSQKGNLCDSIHWQTTKEEGVTCTCHLNLAVFLPLPFSTLSSFTSLFHSQVKQRKYLPFRSITSIEDNHHHACI